MTHCTPQLNLILDTLEADASLGSSGMFRCADFFAGSGLATAALSHFFETVWANDICPRKQAVFSSNHAHKPFLLGSIEHVHGNSIPQHDLSWASFPCQDLSLAGNMSGIRSARSGMVWEWLRVLDETRVKPAIVVAENVKGLLSSRGGENYLFLHEALKERGYAVGAVLLDAVHWLPQSRPRIFVIGVRNHINLRAFTTNGPGWAQPNVVQSVAKKAADWQWWKLPQPTARTLTLEDVIDMHHPFDDEKTVRHHLSLIPDKHWKKINEAIKQGKYIFPGYKRTRAGRQVLEVRTDGIAGCLRTASGGSSRQQLLIYKNGTFGTRLLTISEAARLMGAPSGYQIPGSYNQGYQAMGDAIAVPAVSYLAKHLLHPLLAQ
ncbi:DNA cytosine methyltransferase [Oceanimonas smirnovii]|uniref:DNA cytosine methyltransferase n=1 Tax=Oceanimonas TaxID=129577 RepID=UPI0029353B90|nr:DNA cytosine methyltransferase [Oceanimonas sp. CAM02]MDV2858364.1 DNA cytosine methyltransferase [Oceanimonas sp. CAM02]